MTWWGVRLDGVALINLIMCIGFSVDHTAHICYHYLTGNYDLRAPINHVDKKVSFEIWISYEIWNLVYRRIVN